MPSDEEKRQALRSMFAQTREGQVQPGERPATRPPEQAVRDLSQVRPVVQQTVERQEAAARQVFGVAVGGFIATRPEIESEMRRADSQLLRFFRMSGGSS